MLRIFPRRIASGLGVLLHKFGAAKITKTMDTSLIKKILM